MTNRAQLPGLDEAATGRLAAAVTASTHAYRTRLSVELALIQGLLNMGDPSTAAGALEQERAALEGFANGLREALVQATAPPAQH